MQGLDIGPDSLKAFQGSLADCKTVIWNGPMGVFEFEKFAKGTFGVAETLAGILLQDSVAVISWQNSTFGVTMLDVLLQAVTFFTRRQ